MATGDQYFDKVVLGLDFDNGLVDKSGYNHGIAAYGSAGVSNVQSKFGGYSAYFDGDGDYLTFQQNDCFNLYQKDFTIECWVYITGSGDRQIVGYDNISTDFWDLRINSTGNVVFRIAGNGAALTSTSTVANSQWTHIAAVCKDLSTTIYINGIAAGNVAAGISSANGARVIAIGANVYGGAYWYYFNGYIDDLRITKGVARYTSNFTPEQCKFYYAQLQGTVQDSSGNFTRRLVRAHRRSDGKVVDETLSNISTGEFTLNCPDASKHYAVVHDSDAWITYLPFNGDNDSTLIYEWGGKQITPYGNAKLSTAQSKFGGSSLYLDGTGDYLSIPMSNDLAFGTGDFTVECWVYISTTGVERAIFDSRAASTDTGLYFCITSTNQLSAFTNNATIATGTTALTGTAWHHVSLVKYAGVVTLYLNGLAVASAASTSMVSCPTNPVLGRKLGSTTNDFSGYVDDLRISKGVARYITNFTPPTAPHDSFSVGGDPHWSNVVLACRFTGVNESTVFTDYTGKTMTAYGNAKISTAQSPFGSASLYLDGSGDSVKSSSIPTIGTGVDFTIEFFVYPTVYSGYQQLIANDTPNGFACAMGPAGLVDFGHSLINTVATGTVALTLNQWSHVAFSRTSNTLKQYINGVLSGTFNAQDDFTGGPVRIGADGGGTVRFLNGYLSDLKITIGVGVYQSDFTTPTESVISPPTYISNSAAQDGDPYWNNVVFASHFEGQPDNGDQYRNEVVLNMRGNDLTDDTGREVTVYGNTAVTTVSGRTAYGGKAMCFDGSGDFIDVDAIAISNYVGDVTFEAWLNLSALPTGEAYNTSFYILGGGPARNATGFDFALGATTIWFSPAGYYTRVISCAWTPVTGVWFHIALTRSGNTWRLFKDGVLISTATDASALAALSQLAIGRCEQQGGEESGYFNGYIDDLRITKGVARYTANFTPPTSEIPEVTPVATDLKQSSVVCRGGAVNSPDGYYADGCLRIPDTSVGESYIKVPNHSGITFSFVDDFTIEAWVKPTGWTTYGYWLSKGLGSSRDYACSIQSNSILFYCTPGDVVISGSYTFTLGSWYHVAHTKKGNTIYTYVNGVLITSAVITSLPNTNNPMFIGGFCGYENISHHFKGYIDDLRITKGVARYTANFTPPALPFKDTLQTFGQQNAMIFDYLTPV